jgi:hypothetical protein
MSCMKHHMCVLGSHAFRADVYMARLQHWYVLSQPANGLISLGYLPHLHIGFRICRIRLWQFFGGNSSKVSLILIRRFCSNTLTHISLFSVGILRASATKHKFFKPSMSAKQNVPCKASDSPNVCFVTLPRLVIDLDQDLNIFQPEADVQKRGTHLSQHSNFGLLFMERTSFPIPGYYYSYIFSGVQHIKIYSRYTSRNHSLV